MSSEGFSALKIISTTFFKFDFAESGVGAPCRL
jgi:hypothetical protein